MYMADQPLRYAHFLDSGSRTFWLRTLMATLPGWELSAEKESSAGYTS